MVRGPLCSSSVLFLPVSKEQQAGSGGGGHLQQPLENMELPWLMPKGLAEGAADGRGE